MTWRNDVHGLLFSSGELKLFRPSHTWAMKLSQLPRQAGEVRILTYSFPDPAYVDEQLARRPHRIRVIGHARFVAAARAIADAFPSIEVRVTDTMHSKVVLIAPATLYIGSANFGRSRWHETTIGVRSVAAHGWLAQDFDDLWTNAERVQSAPAATGANPTWRIRSDTYESRSI